MKNSLKFISIGLVMVLLLMSQWSVDRSVEAAAVVVAEDTVEWMDTSAEVVSYYSPGSGTSTASFWLKDTALEFTNSASSTWAGNTSTADNTVYTIHAGTVSNGTKGTFSTSTGSTFDATKPASTTISSLSVTRDGSALSSSLNATLGTFTLFGNVANKDVIATYDYHTTNTYDGSTDGQKIAKVTSTSDSTGEWISISEVTASGSVTPDDEADFYKGSVIISDDAGATAEGDGSVWVADGDTLTVSYYGPGTSPSDTTDNATVIDSTDATIDYADPTITVTGPADGTLTSDKTPAFSFSVADSASGFTATTPLTYVTVTVNGCNLITSEHSFSTLTTTELGMTIAIASLTDDWITTATGGCSSATSRTAGGFGIGGTAVATTTTGTHHGTEFSYSIVATDIAGNSKTVDGDDANVTIDTQGPNMQSAIAGKAYDSDAAVSTTCAASATPLYCLDTGDIAGTNSVKVVFDESLDQASVAASDFTVDDVTPASVSFGGKDEMTDRLVYLAMSTDFSPGAKPVVKVVGTVTDQAGNALNDKPTGVTTGTDLSGSATDGYADKVTATDGVNPTVSDAALDGTLLASKGEAVLTFNSDENMKDNGNTVAQICTCAVVAGGGAAQAISGTTGHSAKLAVTLTSPTAGKATFKQTDYTATGIYGIVIQAKDVNNNEGNSGGVKITNEDVSAEIAADLAATSTTATIGLKKWPLADHDADGDLTDGISATVNGTAVTIAVSSINWTETEEVTVAFTGAAAAVKGTDTVKLTYYYVDASQVVEVDVSKPEVSAFSPLDGTTTENRTPFISVTWDEDEYAGDTSTTVTLTAATLTDPDGTASDILANMSTTDNKDFFYRPADDLSYGEYTFKVSAQDAAGNEKTDQSAKFTVSERSKTSISLLPGWNLVSLPGTPSDTAINSVITNAQVDTVLTYDPTVPGGWLTAVRDSGGDLVGTLAAVDADRGYWVHTTNDDPIKVDIPGYSGGSQQLPPAIALVKGWNLVPSVSITGAAVAATMDPDVYFTGLSWTRAYGFGTATDAFTGFVPTSGASDTANDSSVVIGRGYWLFLSEAGTLVP
ncbi:hypothetical protein M1N56_03175 [Dehalococcoidia bacterium]|nr:hypothetical protein [Dehalococcoidia bacterium]